jgi:hypothetical protein
VKYEKLKNGIDDAFSALSTLYDRCYNKGSYKRRRESNVKNELNE